MKYDDAFLQSILENPDDDAPRLIYADYLEERGIELVAADGERVIETISHLYNSPGIVTVECGLVYFVDSATEFESDVELDDSYEAEM